jgi:outer membrane protein assembly factor BamA
VALVLLCAPVAHAQTAPGVVAEVRIHGNHTTPDADIFALVGDVIDKPATEALVAEITRRLEQSGRFDSVEVRIRYRSIDNPDDVLLMVIVDEVAGIDEFDLTPSPMKKFRSSGMFLPILRYDDGYGFTYGLRTSFVDRLGPRSRISVPLSWGGERQARLQIEQTYRRGPIQRGAGEFGINRRENPHYEIGDTRTFANARAEGAIGGGWLRYGAGFGVADVSFGDIEDRLETYGADVTLDTRVDPAFPRNAVHAKFGWERLNFDAGRADRTTVDARGYLGLFRGTVLALRGLSITASQPLPVYEHNLLGGPSSLRGFDTGYQADDNIAAASAELRIPLTSPLSIGRFGVKIFADYGAAYPHGQKLADQTFDLGIGGGAYLHLTLLSMGLDVAKGRGGDWHFQFGMGVTFK